MAALIGLLSDPQLKSLFYKKYRMTGSKITPIAWDFLTFMKEASMPIGVEITKMKNPKSPVNR